MTYTASEKRYEQTPGWFRRCGKSGLFLPSVSLGCWHNFGGVGTDSGHHNSEADFHENARRMLFTAFDVGITHFDLANNYGPPPGSAEERVGRILKDDFAAYRDELVISTKAGYRMYPGPYGEWGSRKYLLDSLNQSLKRLQTDHVDIFYSHRLDPNTPLEETLGALDSAVKQGKAIYAGISNYDAAWTERAFGVCEKENFARPIIHQPRYSMFDRNRVEGGLLDAAGRAGFGIICFSPLEQGLLTDKYLKEIPADSRASLGQFLKPAAITEQKLKKIRALNDIAGEWGGTLAQLALKWCLRDSRMTTVLIGASRPDQIRDCAACAGKPELTAEILKRIDTILAG